MTSAEASALVVDLTRALSEVTRERDSWRIVARVAIHQAAELRREVAMIDAHSAVQRQQAEDCRSVFLDQTDLRRADHAA